jgi:hypothetical protein
MSFDHSFDENAGLNKKHTFNKKEKETRSISGKRRELDVRNCQRFISLKLLGREGLSGLSLYMQETRNMWIYRL